VQDPATAGYARSSTRSLDANGEIEDTGTLILDDTTITVESITPANGSVGVLRTTPVVIRFSDPLANTSGVNVKEAGVNVGFSRALSADGLTLTLTTTWPDSALLTIEITEQVTDTFGRHPVTMTTSTFHAVDTTAPKVASITPADDSHQVAANAAITVTFTEPIVNTSVDGLIVVTDRAKVVVNGTAVHGLPDVVTFTPTTPLADNDVFTVTVNGAIDSTGNQQTLASTTRFATNDTVPPVLAITSPAVGGWTNDATPVIAITRSDATSGIDVNSGTVVIDGTAVVPARFTGVMQYQVPVAGALADGTHTVDATSSDAAGNVGSTSGSFMVDSTPPSIAALLGLAEDAILTGPTVITATATDALSGVARIELRRGGQPVLNLMPGGFTGTWTLSGTADGRHALTVRAFDLAGNVGPESAPINVIVNRDPLTVTITRPVANFTTRKPFTAEATVSEPVERVEFTFAGVTTVDTSAPFTADFSVDGLPDANMTLTARAFGLIGDTDDDSRTIVIDRSSPIARWPFDEGTGTTTADASGNNHAGTLQNGPAWAATGYTGKAIAFDGVDDAVTVAHTDDLAPPAAMTLAAWIAPSSFGAVRTVIDKAGSYTLGLGADGRAEAVVQVNGSAVVAQAVSPVPLDLWSHVAATYDGSALRLFVAGIEVDAIAATGAVSVTNNALLIGRGEVANAFAGKLDEVRLYERALSATEVQALAASQVSGAMLGGGFRVTWIAQPGGPIWSMGQNNGGSLGNSTGGFHQVPVQVSTLSDVAAIAGDLTHAFAITKTGALYAWGGNANGVLGDGTTTNRSAPVLIALDNVVQIATGTDHSIALVANGDVYAWGSNASGQFGDGTNSGSLVPKKVMTGVRAVGAGDSHSIFIKADGSAWASGSNHSGQLGRGFASSQTQSTAAPMTGVTTAVAATGSGSVSVVLLSNGTLVAAGAGSLVGDGTQSQRNSPVAVINLADVVAVESGNSHFVALKADGTVWAWGHGSSGELGQGVFSIQRNAPVQVPGLADIVHIGAGDNNSFAVSASGVVYGWGDGGFGVLGDGVSLSRPSPISISIENYQWRVATPAFTDYGFQTHTADRQVQLSTLTAGATIHYTLDGSIPTEGDPIAAPGTSILINATRTLSARAFKAGMPPSNVEAVLYRQEAAQPTFVITPGVFAPGRSSYPAAQSVEIRTTTPNAAIYYTLGTVANPPPNPTDASTLYTAPLTIATNTVIRATAYRTGYSPSSSPATRTMTFYYGPTPAPIMSPAAGTHIGSVTINLSTPLPGADVRYTLDGNTPGPSSTLYAGPFTLTSTKTVKARVFHPDYETLAETSGLFTVQAAAPQFSLPSGDYPAGTAVTVTADSFATIRYTVDGSEPTTAAPTIASGGTVLLGNFTLKARAFQTGATESVVTAADYTLSAPLGAPQIASGGEHVMLRLEDGRVVGWGSNIRGHLGYGDPGGTRPRPFVFNSLTGVISVGAGTLHSLAATADGRLWAFGDNTSGQIGDNSSIQRDRPVLIESITNVVAVAAGAFHSVALLGNGDAYAWGANSQGQLGDGTSALSRTPKLVMTGVKAIAAGANITLFVKLDGSAWATGINGNGQLCDGTKTQRTQPVQMSGISNAVAVTAGQFHSAVLLADGTVRVCGAQDRIGDGTRSERLVAATVANLANVVAIDAGDNHTVALKGDGTVWTWGSTNNAGQLGNPAAAVPQLTPIQVTGLEPAVAIGSGPDFSHALTGDGVVYAWGGPNTRFQLGDGGNSSRSVPVALSEPGYVWKVATPWFNTLTSQQFSNINVRVENHTPGATIHYTRNGADPAPSDPVVASGANLLIDTSQTLKARAFKDGMPASNVETAVYTMVLTQPSLTQGGIHTDIVNPKLVSISGIVAGAVARYTLDGSVPTEQSTLYTGTFAVHTTTTVRARNFKAGWTPSTTDQQTYTMRFGTLATPTATPAPGSYVGSVMVSLAAMPGATIHYNTINQVAGTGSPVYTGPFPLTQTTTVRARAVHPDWINSAELVATYTVQPPVPTISLASGVYDPGATLTITGDPSMTIRISLDGTDPTTTHPEIVSGTTLFAGNYTVKARSYTSSGTASAVSTATYSLSSALAAGSVADGNTHAALATPDGRVLTWGRNSNGKLGDGTLTDRRTAAAINNLTGVIAVSAMAEHNLALTLDGRVYAWGDNLFGQLGDGSTADRRLPVLVPSLIDIVQVRAGVDHSLALTADGQVFAWGTGFDGQLGNGSMDLSSPVPSLVGGLPPVKFIAAGDDTSYAVTTDGAVYAWGLNDWGQLGDGTLIDRATPTLIAVLSDIDAVEAGEYHALARTRDGRTFVWGANDFGQYGIGSISPGPVTTPVEIAGFSSAAFSVSWGSTMALRVDGALLAWGYNTNGEIGDGTTTHRELPTLVNGPASVSAFEIGQRSMIVTPEGAVWTWGFSNSGFLYGDSNTFNRRSPQHAFTVAGLWAPAPPIFSVLPGTYSDAVSLLVSSSAADATIRYTTDGSVPDESSLEVPADGVIPINSSTTIRARVFAPGRVPSAVTSGSYVITP
jgi:alpha-tubulin suppressor-like RCC1 family protein